MGTSKSLSTPSGGAWSALKEDITSQLGHSPRCSIPALVANVLQAAGGIGTVSSLGGLGSASGSGGASSTGSAGARARASRAIAGLGGFGAAVAEHGLGLALDRLGLGDLRDRPAVEVVARVAEHLSAHSDELDRPLLTTALRDTLLEVANLGDSVGYSDLAESLGAFLEENGVEGLVESFLANIIYDPVWCLVEQWVLEKSESATDTEALRSSVEHACRQLARDAVGSLKVDGRFDSGDWFGTDGVTLGRDIVRNVERQLTATTSGEE